MSVFIISTVAVVGPNFFGGGPNQSVKPGFTITGTPADNYPDNQRSTFCENGEAKSNNYITEFRVPTSCTQPLGITTDSSGNVWFTEANTGNIAKFDPVTKVFTEYKNQQWQKGDKSMMWGIASTLDGNMWFSDSGHNLIWKFSTANQNYTSFSFPVTQGQQPFPQMLFIEGKTIFVNDFSGRKIASFNSDQQGPAIDYFQIPSPGNYNFTSPTSTDSKGNLWYVVWIYQKGGQLVRYNPNTKNMTEFEIPDGVEAPNGISIASDGKIWLTDTATSLFFTFDPQSKQFTKFTTPPPPFSTYGNVSGLIKTPISRPYWNHFDDKGRLWFNEQTGNSIAVFDPSKEYLVEYLVPSKNPKWSDCGGLADCGVAQVLDFATNDDKVWFTEWVENNIGFLDPAVPLPIQINTDQNNITLQRGQNITITSTVNPNEQLNDTISIVTANTGAPNDIIVSGGGQNTITTSQSKAVPMNISIDNFAVSGTYKVLIGARYGEVTVSKFVTITIK